MTGYTVHTGSSEKFSEGWDQIFKQGQKKAAAKKAETPAAAGKAASEKKAPKKTTKK